MKKLKHLIRYGTAQDNQFIKEHASSLDLLAINANLLCHHSENISRAIYVDFSKIGYFIEPKLYVYQNDLRYIKKNDIVKKSYTILANQYNLEYIIDRNEHLQVKELTDNKLEELVECTFDFQQNWVYDNLNEELKEFSKLSNLKKEPEFLVIPSFYIRDIEDMEWYYLNLKLIQKSLQYKNQYNQKNMYANLIIGQEILNNTELIELILNEYSIADGLLLWINNFNELSVDEKNIESLIYLVQTYKKQNPQKEIFSLYGGYFQELLNNIGLDGVCHSVAYGESKEVCSLGGAPVVQKYYMPNLFQRMKPETMIKLLHNLKLKNKYQFYEKVCDCGICKINIFDDNIYNRFLTYLDAIDDNNTSRNNARINCIKHYLEVKCNEFINITERDFLILIEELKEIFDTYIDKEYLEKEDIYYLQKWYNCLKKYK
ncbi:hypothetical protein ACOL20_04020 [Aliarcobacter butzleri]